MSDSATETKNVQESPRWKGILQLTIIVLVVATAIWFARAPSREFLELDMGGGLTRLDPTAEILQPEPTNAAHTIALTGTVGTLGEVVVVPESSGDIVYVAENFRNGGEFTKDETLVQIDKTTYQIALDNANLALEDAEAHLREVLDKHSRGDLSLARNDDGEINLWMNLDGEIDQAKARVEMAKNRIRLREIALDETRIRMPFDGYVMATQISVGQVVTSHSSRIGQVYAKNELRVRVPISSFDLDSLQPVIGRAAKVIVDGRAYQTEVERVSRRVDVETRLGSLYLFVLDQENTEYLPRPGSFADVIIEGPQRENVFVLPEASLQINGSVWLVNDGELVSFTPKSLGYTNDGWLVSAFDPMDGVVVGSISGAREGLAVNTTLVQQPQPE